MFEHRWFELVQIYTLTSTVCMTVLLIITLCLRQMYAHMKSYSHVDSTRMISYMHAH